MRPRDGGGPARRPRRGSRPETAGNPNVGHHGSRPETAGNPNVGRPSPAPRPAPVSQPGPYTNTERKAVAKNRKTPAYHAAIKSAYKQGTPASRAAQRRRINTIPASKWTPEQHVVMHTHAQYLKGTRAADLYEAAHYRINSKPASQWTAGERKFMRSYKLGQEAAMRVRSSQIFTDAQRRMVHHQEIAARAHWLPELTKLQAKPTQHASDIYETDPKKLAALGFHKASTADKLMEAPLGALVSGVAVADATYHDPLGVPLKTLKQIAHAAPAVPGGLVDLVQHPGKTISEQAKQFGERSSQPFDKRVATIRKEGGLNYGGDALAVTGVGSAASAGAKELLRGSVKDALERDGKIAVRTSGGAVKRVKDRGALSTAGRHYLLTRRAKKAEKALTEAEAGGKPIDALSAQVAQANRDAGHVVESLPRKPGFAQRRSVAHDRGQSIYGFKADKGRRTAADEKAINQLNAKEKKAFYYAAALGVRTPEQAGHVLSKLRETIKANRAHDGIQVTGSLKKSDMLPEIDALLKDPSGHFTEKLGQVVESLRADSERAAAEDPRLHPFVVERRRFKPVAQALGLEQGRLPDVPPAEPHHRIMYHVVRDTAVAAGTKLEGIRDQGLKPSSNGSVYLYDDLKQAEEFARGGGHILAINVDGLDVGGAEGAATRSIRGTIPADRIVGVDGTPARPAIPPLKDFDEHDEAFVKRIATHAKELGLADPLYVKSERYVGPAEFAAHAVGGRRAMKRRPPYTGANLDVGLQDTSPRMYLQGKAENIKAKHNWNLVANLLDRNALRDLAPDQPGGSTVSALRETLAQKGIDMNSVALWNPGVYRRTAHDFTAAEKDVPDGSQFDQSEHYDNANALAAMQHSVIRLQPGGGAIDGSGLPAHAGALAESSGWHVVPVTVLHELEAQMTPSGKYGRGFDIVKGKASRLMLAGGNIPWLGFQVISNIGAAAAATGGRALNPANWVNSARWWHELTPAKRDEIGGKLGLDVTGADSHQVRLGASTNSDMVNMYRAFKAHPFWHTGIAKGHGASISELNPFELMVKADRKQNNAARIIAAYSMAKRDTVRRMGESMGHADAAQLKLTSILAKPPAEQLRALADDPHVLEDHAEAIADWMGDYTTMTASERKVINRVVMFYPYLRYSLRLLFYTLPVKHPAVTAVLAELGQMREEELKKLLGSQGELPWNLGKIYFGSKGDVKSIDLSRANPALNSIVDAINNRSPEQLIGVLPPYAGVIYDQFAQRSYFAGHEWRVNGHAAQFGGPHLPLFDKTRGRILANDIAGLFYPYREATKLTQSGAQGDDSLLGSPRPTVYHGTRGIDKLNRKFSKRRTEFNDAHKSLAHDLVPWLPRPERDPAAQAREDRILKRATPKPGGSKKSKAKYFGAGSGGTSYFGASN